MKTCVPGCMICWLSRCSEASAIVEAALKMAEASGGSATAEVTQLTDQATFDEHCSGKRICVIAFLSHILDEYVRCCAMLPACAAL